MPTLRRIVKYTPASFLGLLLVAWTVNFFGIVGLGTRSGISDFHYTITNHALTVGRYDGNRMMQGWFWYPKEKFSPGIDTSPYLRLYREPGTNDWLLTIPIAFAATLILPLAIGPFLSFRFRLWHCLAYTALVAIELAYYLRWQ